MIAISVTGGTRAEQQRVFLVIRIVASALHVDHATVEIALVGDRDMAHNVLTYPASSTFPRPDVSGTFLGDICLNPSYISRLGHNFDYLLIHGFLHLLGYDHERARDRIKMERKESVLISLIPHASHSSRA